MSEPPKAAPVTNPSPVDDLGSRPVSAKDFREFQDRHFSVWNTVKHLLLSCGLAILLLDVLVEIPSVAKKVHNRAVCGFSHFTGYTNDYTEYLCDPEVRKQRVLQTLNGANGVILDMRLAFDELLKDAIAHPRPEEALVASMAPVSSPGAPRSATKPVQQPSADPTVAQ